MSDSQSYEKVDVSSEGVTVVKRFEEDEFPVPAIAFEFESDRDESVTVRMNDTVPEQIEVEDLGFHPEYGSEYWTIDDETITFERELEAGGNYTTVYGIRATGSDDVEQFLTEPELERVEPPLPEDATTDDEIIPETDDDVVKDAIAGDGEIPGLEEDDEGEASEDGEDITLNLNDPNESGTGASAESADGTEGASVTLEGGNLTSALAAEIRQQNVSGEDLKLLRRALDVAQQNDGADQARIEQLQSDIADLRAYTAAMEEFLDENGTGQQMIEEFERELATFDDRLDSLEADLSANADTLESVTDEVDAIESTVTAVDDEVDSLSTDLDQVAGEVEDVSTDVDDVSTSLEDLDASIEEIENDVADLEASITDEDVSERIDELESELASLQTWQEQIKETFGGG